MNEVGPPRIAPKDVPHAAALYLDNAAHYLGPFVKEHELNLKPYDQYQPDQTAWCHSMYGACRDREFCIQVVTDADLAPAFHADVRGYVRLYPKDHGNAWLPLGNRRVGGMHEMLAAADETIVVLRLACVLRMPHPTDPDPKA